MRRKFTKGVSTASSSVHLHLGGAMRSPRRCLLLLVMTVYCQCKSLATIRAIAGETSRVKRSSFVVFHTPLPFPFCCPLHRKESNAHCLRSCLLQLRIVGVRFRFLGTKFEHIAHFQPMPMSKSSIFCIRRSGQSCIQTIFERSPGMMQAIW